MVSYSLCRLLTFLHGAELIQWHADMFVAGTIFEL